MMTPSFYFRIIVFVVISIFNVDFSFADKNKPSSLLINISNLPSANEHFTGREAILDQIHKGFKQGEYIIPLVGFLGTGKTQIARRFAEKSKAEYDIVWFIDAKRSIVDQLRGLATCLNSACEGSSEKKINPNAQPANFLVQMHNFLKSTPKKWLLILDNVQERGAILDFLPPRTSNSRGKILVTTRSEIGWDNPIRVGNFSRQESISLLKDIIKTNNEDHLDKLAVLLFNHPLSLAQAGCYIRKYNHTSTSNYISLFKSCREDLWKKEETMIKEDKDIKDLHDNYQMTGSTALRLSLDELKKRSPLGITLLYHTAFLHNTEISTDILSVLCKTLGYEPIFECNEAIHQLTKLSLLEKDRLAAQNEPDNSLFNMHDLTQVILLDVQSPEAQKQAIQTNMDAFAQLLPAGWDKAIKELTQRPYLLAHIENLIAHAKEQKVYSPSLIKLMTDVLEYHMFHTREQQAYVRLVKEIDSILREAKDIPSGILARFYIDRVYVRSPSVEGEENFNKKMIQDFEKAIQTFQEMPDQTDELFRAYMNFAQYYFLTGKFDEAKQYTNKAEEIIHKVKSESYKNLFFFAKSWILCEMEEYALAQESINEAIHRLDKEENNALKIYIKNMKAWADLKVQDFDGANKWAETAYADAQDFFDHENTDSIIWSTLVLGAYKLRKGDLAGAETAIKESLVKLEREYEGPYEVTDQAYAHNILGDIYTQKEKFNEAKEEYQLAEKIYNKIYKKKEGIGISELYVSFAILGAKLKDDFLVKRYLDLHKKYYGADHAGTIQIMNTLRENHIEVLN